MCFVCWIVCFSVVGFFCFFFKQKTSYEMRISDWSSDVCSSDLDKIPLQDDFAALAPFQQGAGLIHDLDPRQEHRPPAACEAMRQPLVGERQAMILGRQEDRKSVVAGKRESVRVDLRGRRYINKKTPQQQQTTKYPTDIDH